MNVSLLMFACAGFVRLNRVHVASLLTQSSAAYGYGGLAIDRDVFIPVPYKLRDAFPFQYSVDKWLFSHVSNKRANEHQNLERYGSKSCLSGSSVSREL